MSALKTVCAYVRVSTDKQEELSPDSQIREIKAYAQAHNMIVSKVYMEEKGISGSAAKKRTAFQDMIAACKDKSHPFDAVLVWKFSRFARNRDESTYYKSILRKKCNVDVISISEPIIDGMYGQLIEMVIEWSDEFYLVNLSGEVMRGMTENAMRGGYNANVPFGYSKKKGKESVPVINPEEASVIKRIFRMFTEERIPLSDISATLNKEGIHTSRGGLWETRTISYILENPFYIGKIRWNYFDRKHNKRKSKADVIVVDGKHEAIISDEQFALSGKLLAEMRSHTGYGKKRSAVGTGHFMSGMIKCSHCGASLGFQKEIKGQRTAYFSCWKNGKGMCDVRNHISKTTAEAELFAALDELTINGAHFEYDERVQQKDPDELHRLEKELANIDNKLKRIKDAFINGIDTIEEYRENKQLVMEFKTKIEKALSNEKRKHPVKKKEQRIDFEIIKEMLQDDTVPVKDKANAIRAIFDHFTWDRDTETFDFYLNENVKM